MKIITVILGVGLVLTLAQCKKEEQDPPQIVAQIELQHFVGSEALEMDVIKYTNAAGNEFSVKRLLYYLSGIVLEDENGVRHTIDGAYYVDIEDASTLQFALDFVPQGKYKKLEFSLGLVPELNVFGNLPNTVENSAMFWPEQMGGGYHFMKLEGHYNTDSSEVAGYAMHIGTNPTRVDFEFNQGYTLDVNNISIELRMNILEWFQNPVTYDLNQGNYSMGNAALMLDLTNNGKDVFTLNP